jgi:hypothetical protein
MPTREYAELVTVITETIEQVLTADPTLLPDADQVTQAGITAAGPVHAFVVDYEKIVWHYPDAVARLIEE